MGFPEPLGYFYYFSVWKATYFLLLIFFFKGKTKNVMLVQFLEHRDALNYLRFIVLLASLNGFLVRGRQKNNCTKVNEVLISYGLGFFLKKRQWKMVRSMLFFFFL